MLLIVRGALTRAENKALSWKKEDSGGVLLIATF